ncbi:bifunctional nuclease family protein [Methanoregula sp.]|uniref:bifunctional nuclease family protein n=1 Tax=Methanoregula sp. TaxID=2052170 RepID=UPI002CDF17CF|nr:bifunctional nuclease family protein [Methanoregula sp.]HVP97078.1 bifunctional nuclease family protein [Methanoregula sp.]
MQQVRCGVRGVFVAMNDTATIPAVVLADDAGRLMPIYVGLWEAVSISSAQNKEVPPRPFTHDLFLDLMGKYAISVDRLEIDSVEDGVYYAHLVLVSDGRTESLDCRPSDGIAVALRAGAPVLVEEGLLAAAGQNESMASMVDLSVFLQK